MNFLEKILNFFFLVRTEERCWITWTLRLENSFENKLALYTKISETGGGKVTCITKKVYLSKKQLYKCIYNICSSCH